MEILVCTSGCKDQTIRKDDEKADGYFPFSR